VVTLTDAALNVFLALNVPIATFLVVSPIARYGVIGCALLWTLAHAKRGKYLAYLFGPAGASATSWPRWSELTDQHSARPTAQRPARAARGVPARPTPCASARVPPEPPPTPAAAPLPRHRPGRESRHEAHRQRPAEVRPTRQQG
jgi:hypothetical protein